MRVLELLEVVLLVVVDEKSAFYCTQDVVW